MMQKDIFLQSEGNAWLNRNRQKLGAYDPVSELIDSQNIAPKRVLEVGCADGWRLEKLRRKYGSEVYGVEPSMEAAIEAAARRVPVQQMTASCLPVADGNFDLIIYGFCLYMTDPKDWLLIAAEGDRALVDGGYIVIHDFQDVFQTYRRPYEHRDGLFSYHFNFANLWLAHPLYSLVTRRVHVDDMMVTVLKKLPTSSIEVRA